MLFIPTYLYIKQHAITGKLYFGKTIQNPETYLGSGERWLNHINKHGKEHVVNLWYCLFYDKDELTKFATTCSQQWNIVESDTWLNTIPENGLDGCPPGLVRSTLNCKRISESKKGHIHSEETKIKIGSSNKGKPRPKSELHKKKLSDAAKGKSQIQLFCPHCGATGGNILKRWHFDKCKSLL